jgi:thioredoxin reductase (NADPH)
MRFPPRYAVNASYRSFSAPVMNHASPLCCEKQALFACHLDCLLPFPLSLKLLFVCQRLLYFDRRYTHTSNYNDVLELNMEKTQCLIIGGGPAGLSAAIYTARAGVNTLVLGCDPKVAGDYGIDNYFGFEESISGRDLMDRGHRQAARFGADIRCEKVLGVHFDEPDGFTVKTEQSEYQTRALILATGVSRNRPKIPKLGDYEGKGISYCVSCDGYFFRGKPVMVAGEGIFAANQALELLTYTPHVTICTLGKEPAIPAQFMAGLETAGIEIITDAITALGGERGLSSITLSSGKALNVEGIFIAQGEASSTDFAYTLGVTRKGAFIEVDTAMRTNVPGVFAAGDCTGGFLQIAVAVGEGALAGRSVITWLKEQRV